MSKPIRVMWLLNHSSARKFEISMLNKIGIDEIFTPKSFPNQVSFRSASVNNELDDKLTIPKDDLEYLNAQDWYGTPDKKAWELANKYFDVLFFILFNPASLRSIFLNFQGAILWRAYGMVSSVTHSFLAKTLLPNESDFFIGRMGQRFWFAEAYNHLHEIESETLSRRSIYLPLGLADDKLDDRWNGDDRRVFFICPDIETNDYYGGVYKKFIKYFDGIPRLIGGAQSIRPLDPTVAGYVPVEEHQRNMRELRLMFYHSQEPNHIHYHPFEAIRAGMPLVFMAGGMLDRMGGKELPGRCVTTKEARKKIERILSGDKELIDDIRRTQTILLENMKPENCEMAWKYNFQKILDELHNHRRDQLCRPDMLKKRKRIAVIVPAGYRGGSLRGAKLLAEALLLGSDEANEAADIVFVHLDNNELYSEADFSDIDTRISRRSFKWKILSAEEARRAMRYAGHDEWEPVSAQYMVPDDGIRQLLDCDLWMFISDRLTHPLLPVRPYMLMLYDYLQRYVPILPHGADQSYIDAARKALRVLVTTEFTRQDALQYAGINDVSVCKVPMLVPDFSSSVTSKNSSKDKYFIWTTNANIHKNHEYAIRALDIYYRELGGQFHCRVTGVNTGNMLSSDMPHLKLIAKFIDESKILQENINWQNELSDTEYKQQLSSAQFLWHAGRIDNGTFSVIEAAYLGVPSLSSDYPAMREIDQQFGLNITWMDAGDPQQMAEQLKWMELNASICHLQLPTVVSLQKQNVKNLAKQYWDIVRECL